MPESNDPPKLVTTSPWSPNVSSRRHASPAGADDEPGAMTTRVASAQISANDVRRSAFRDLRRDMVPPVGRTVGTRVARVNGPFGPVLTNEPGGR